MRRASFISVALTTTALVLSSGAANAVDVKIGFLPGVVDPFYQVMQLGVEGRGQGSRRRSRDPNSADLGRRGPDADPRCDGRPRRPRLHHHRADRQGPDGGAAAGTRSKPASRSSPSIRSSATATMSTARSRSRSAISAPTMSRAAASRPAALPKAIGGKGIVYINSTNPNVSSVEGREQGFKEVMEKEFPDIKVLGPDYNLDDLNKAQQQTAAVLEHEPRSCRRVRHERVQRQGAGNAVVNAGLGGHVQVVAYDATKEAIELMNKGVVSLVLAQKPFDMGYMARAVRRSRRRWRHQPAAPGRDRVRNHRQGKRQGSGLRALHLSGSRPVTADQSDYGRERTDQALPLAADPTSEQSQWLDPDAKAAAGAELPRASCRQSA